jgi:hypothetical protein
LAMLASFPAPRTRSNGNFGFTSVTAVEGYLRWYYVQKP